MVKLSHVLAAIGVAPLVFGAGMASGAATGTTVAGKPAQVQLFSVPVTSGPVPAPQPDSTPFPIIQTTVTVGAQAHAVVSLEAPSVALFVTCTVSPGPPPTQIPGDAVVVVDGALVQTLATGDLHLTWTPPIGPGTHTVAWSLVCPHGSGDNPADTYQVLGQGPAPVRVEVIKVP